MLSLLMGCSSYKDSMQGSWKLVEIRNENGDKTYPLCVDGKCDVVELSFETQGTMLVVTGVDASGKTMRATYHIREDGRLVNTNQSRPNMYILDIDANKVVLIDRDIEDGHERVLVFKKGQ